jgi:hypothetical protein
MDSARKLTPVSKEVGGQQKKTYRERMLQARQVG